MPTKKQLIQKAKQWSKMLAKILEEHAELENDMDNPDDHEEFVAVGMALGNLEVELNRLIES